MQNELGQEVGQLIEAWTPISRPEKKILQGQHCLLDPLNLDKYAENLFKNLCTNNRGETWTYLPYGPFFNKEKFLEWLTTTSNEADTQLYIILNPQGNPLGISGYLRINTEHGVIEVGHLHYSTFLQKTIAATEAMYLMMRYVFDELNVRRYEWKCNSLNKASWSAAERLGFTYEGTFRQSNVFKNYNRDTAWFSIIDSEWPTIKYKFENYLDPKNFTADGKQKRKLSEF